MFYTCIIMILYFLVITSAFADKIEACEEIEELAENKFNEALATNENVFVEFYAKWCAHCRKFDPRYETVYDLVKPHRHIKLAKVNVDENPDLAEKYNVTSYPSFKLFRRGEIIEYSSDRDEVNMANWIIKHSQAYISYIKSPEEFENLKAKNRVCFVMMGSESSNEFSIYLQAVKQAKGTCYGLIQDKGIFGLDDSIPSISVFKHDNEVFLTIVRFERLVEFFNQHQVPWVLPLGDQAIEEVFEKQKTGLFVFTKDPNVKDLLNLLTDYTFSFIQLVYGDLDSAQHLVFKRELGIEGKSMPFALIVDGKMRKFLFEGKINFENLKEFYNSFKSGTADVFYKSEEKISQDGILTKFIGNGFDEEIAKVKTLVAFVIPNCGYCRILTPDLEKLAEQFKDLRVGYIDISLNDLSTISITQFPSVALFSPLQPAGYFYSGNFSAEHIQEYYSLSKNSL